MTPNDNSKEQLTEIPSSDLCELITSIKMEKNAQKAEEQTFEKDDVLEEEPVITPPYTKPKKKKKTVRKVIFRSFLCLFTFLAIAVGGILGGVAIILKGPSVHARDLLVPSLIQASALKFVPHIFLSNDEVNSILANNSVVPTDEVTDVNLVNVKQQQENPAFDKNKIEVTEVKGATFKGLMMTIYDPSRVYVGSSGNYGKNEKGCTVMEMIQRDGCIAGANGGGFEDTGGTGTGGIPLGIVISKGELKYGSLSSTYELIGMDKDNKLVVGKMTAQDALKRNIRDAVSFGPILIVNGKPCEAKGNAGGVNPRTAIGQRSDGAILLLVIDGRQANSLGATYSDLIDVFTQFGAVNAANLDGGSSAHLIYKNEIISTLSSLYGPRKVPTAILVK